MRPEPSYEELCGILLPPGKTQADRDHASWRCLDAVQFATLDKRDMFYQMRPELPEAPGMNVRDAEISGDTDRITVSCQLVDVLHLLAQIKNSALW